MGIGHLRTVLRADRPTSRPTRGERPHRARTACALALISGLIGCGTSPGPGEPVVEGAEIRLVVLLAVDQLRPDRLDAGLGGGLGRIFHEGRRFGEAALDHANTDTCPGHVSISTGRHPGPAGVPGNRMIDPDRLEAIYCVADAVETASVLGRASPGTGDAGRSPRRIKALGLGDWLKAERPGSLVYGVSGKDRAAIALAGHAADAAYWIDRSGTGGFTTSRYYRDALPDWVAAWDAERLAAGVPESWAIEPAILARLEDDRAGESDYFGRVSPHPLSVDAGSGVSPIAPLMASPYLDRKTLDFARELIEREGLGTDAVPDLLGLALSATDYIGHLYGPYSAESADALAKLDRDLADFLGFLDAHVGRAHVLLVLTADHGVLPIAGDDPAVEAACGTPSGRVSPKRLDAGLAAGLDAALPPPGPGDLDRWFRRERHMVVLNRARARAAGVDYTRLADLAAAHLAAQPGIARVWRREELAAQAPREPMAALYLHSETPGYEADLLIEPRRSCLLSEFPTGTSHGSPHDYDRRVPLVFLAPGIAPGEIGGRAATVDIAPTLAAWLGLTPPGELDGRVLPLAGE